MESNRSLVKDSGSYISLDYSTSWFNLPDLGPRRFAAAMDELVHFWETVCVGTFALMECQQRASELNSVVKSLLKITH